METIKTTTNADLMPDWVKKEPVLAQRWNADYAFRCDCARADEQMRQVLIRETYRIYNA